MGKSYRKTPISGITCSESEKDDKKAWHRRHRRKEAEALRAEDYDNVPDIKEVSNPWTMAKDGKAYMPNWKEVLRK